MLPLPWAAIRIRFLRRATAVVWLLTMSTFLVRKVPWSLDDSLGLVRGVS